MHIHKVTYAYVRLKKQLIQQNIQQRSIKTLNIQTQESRGCLRNMKCI